MFRERMDYYKERGSDEYAAYENGAEMLELALEGIKKLLNQYDYYTKR